MKKDARSGTGVKGKSKTKSAQGEGLFTSVLCPVDFSPNSRRALQYAADVAKRSGGRLTVIFARDPLLDAAATAHYDTEALQQASLRNLGRFVERAVAGRGLAASRITSEVVQGRPSAEIARVGRREQVDLVVMGTQGQTGAGRFFFGSTTEKVLRESSVPVLAVPAQGRRIRR